MANDRDWERRSNDWVNTQHKSSKRKAEADKLGKFGKERRKYITHRRPQA